MFKPPHKAAMRLFAALALSFASQASANPVQFLNLQGVQAVVVLIQAGSACTVFVYDQNGNRTAQTVTTLGAGNATWGSGKFGCFLWKPV